MNIQNNMWGNRNNWSHAHVCQGLCEQRYKALKKDTHKAVEIGISGHRIGDREGWGVITFNPYSLIWYYVS